MHEAVGCRWLLEQKFEHLLGNAAAPLHVVVVTSACHHARARWIFDGVFKDAAWARVSFDVSDTTATEIAQGRMDVEAKIWARQLESVASHGGFAGFINAEFDPSGAKHDGNAYRFRFVARDAHDAAASDYRVTFQAA